MSPVKYFYKGEKTDLVVFAESQELVEQYLKEPSVGKLTESVGVFKIFCNRQGEGAEGELGEAVSYTHLDVYKRQLYSLSRSKMLLEFKRIDQNR